MRVLFVAVAAALAAVVPAVSASASASVGGGGAPDCLRTHSCVAVSGQGFCVKIDDGEGEGFCIYIWP